MSGRPQEPANVVRGGHPRTVSYSKMSSKGRTEPQISLSRAKHVEEAAGDICFCVFPQKRAKITKNNFFVKIFQKFPKVSERIRTHPDASECIRAHPNRSEQVRKSLKTCENIDKLAKSLRNVPEIFYKKIHSAVFLSCLLYTSPSPRDATLSRMPSSA